MMLLRVRFAKGEEVRFLSHLDMTKTFERSMRRAGIPIAFSEGFNPHPRFALASALAVGTTSEAEYADFELREAMAPEEFRRRMNEALPPGIRILEAREMPEGTKALMSVVNRAAYRVRGDLAGPLGEKGLQEAIGKFLAIPEVLVERQGKKGPQTKNVREGLYSLTGHISGDQWEMNLTVVTGGQGNLRPEDVVKGLRQSVELGRLLSDEDLEVHRTGLWVAKAEGIFDPFGDQVDRQ